MTGLRPPPSTDTPTRIFGRFVVLIFLLLALGAFIWSAVIMQQIPLVEDVLLEDLDVGGTETVEGIRFHVEDSGTDSTPTFFFHDIDIGGMATFDDLISSLGDDARSIAVDLPGFGLTTRIPEVGPEHTVGKMAERMVAVIEARTSEPSVLVGVGLGGEVAAEVAVLRPDLVAGLVLIDVDFYGGGGWVQTAENVPWMGTAFTYAFETSGAFADNAFAPYCDQGGWCPTRAQAAARSTAASIVDTTESLNAFRNTPAASNVPSLLGDITAPTILVWSDQGEIPRSSQDRVVEAMADVTFEPIGALQAHLQEPGWVADLIRRLLP